MLSIDDTFAPGAAFAGRYTIVERIGQGGMGQVYKALDTKLGEPVALKLVRAGTPEAAGLERFRRELNMARKVSHPNVCRVHDIGEFEGVHFISMEFVEGQTLRDWTRAVGKLSTDQTLSVARQVCAGLAAIHAESIVHRDLKPANIMLDRLGRAVIMDFGLAYQPDSDQLTAEGEVLGTLAYLSPEQARGGQGLDQRSDIYALGLVIFEMLTGARPPADGNSLPMGLRDRTQRCRAPSELVPDIPESLDRVVLRCVEYKRSRRYTGAEALDQALEQVEDELPSGRTAARKARTRTGGTSGRSGLRTRPRLWGGVAAAVVVVALLAVAMTWLWPRAPAGPPRIGVLPFAYEGDESTRFIANLLPIVVLQHLEEVEELETAPFASSRLFDSDEEPISVAQQLEVDWVLGGTIRVDESSYRVTLNLQLAEDGESVWIGEFEGPIAQPAETAHEAARELVAALGRTTDMTPETSGPSADALAAYAEGLGLLEGWDVETNAEGAITAFTHAIEADDDFADAHAALARALWLQYRNVSEAELVDRAINEAQRAVELAPDLPEARLALGIVQLGRGRSAEAAAAFESALRMAPADDAICRRIGQAYYDLGRSEEAILFYDRAVALRPGFWGNHNHRGVFYLNNGEFGPAARDFARVIDLRPDSATGYTNLAGTSIYSGNLEEAGPLLEAAIAIEPTPEGHNNLGFVHYSTRNFEAAAQQFRLGADMAPADGDQWIGLGDAYRQLGREAEARQAYSRALDLFREILLINPNNRDTESAVAQALAGLGRCDDAAETAIAATRGDDDNFDAHYYAAVAFAVCGDYEAAERHALQALEGGYEVDVRTNPDLAPLLDMPAFREALR
jgi:Flp pilus assembly protein TadD/TolB-like protein